MYSSENKLSKKAGGLIKVIYKTLIVPVNCNKSDYNYLIQCNKYSAIIWNNCVKADKESKKKNNKYLTRSQLVYKEYINYLNKYGKSKCLGTWHLIAVEKGKHVANLFGQYDYGRGKQYTDYESLRSALFGLVKIAEEFNKSIAIPYGIGCGLAGGDWKEVYKIIEEVFEDYDVTIYKL